MRFRLRSDDAALARRFAELYSACEVGSIPPTTPMLDVHVELDRVSGEYLVRAGGVLRCRVADVDEALEWCAWIVNSRAVAASGAPEVILHAAAVAAGARAVVLVGPSGAGKSTLATALVLSGLAYMGDDCVALIGDAGRVRSNPKPIALDDTARAALAPLAPVADELLRARRLVAPAAIGAAVRVGRDVETRLIVFPEYRPSVRTAAISPVSRAEAAELVADQSFNFANHGAEGLRAIAALVRHAQAFRLQFDDLSDAVTAITRALGAVVGAVVAPEHERAEPHNGFAIEVVDGETLVWDPQERALHRLSATASAIWNASTSTTSVPAIAAAVAGTTPAPATIEAEVEQCLAELSARGLLAPRLPRGNRRSMS